MNYESFVKEVKKGVEEIIHKKLDDGMVVVREVLKNNNIRMQAVSIVREGEQATPTTVSYTHLDVYKRQI